MIYVSLRERLESVLEDKGWSAREWARLAGLKEPSHVNTMLRRLRQNPDATFEEETLAKLAAAADVSLDWLQLGRGTKDGSFTKIEPDPVYPSRAIAIAAATLAGWRREAIDTVRGMGGFAKDPGLQVWLGLIESEHVGARLLPPGPGGSGSHGKRRQHRKRG